MYKGCSSFGSSVVSEEHVFFNFRTPESFYPNPLTILFLNLSFVFTPLWPHWLLFPATHYCYYSSMNLSKRREPDSTTEDDPKRRKTPLDDQLTEEYPLTTYIWDVIPVPRDTQGYIQSFQPHQGKIQSTKVPLLG